MRALALARRIGTELLLSLYAMRVAATLLQRGLILSSLLALLLAAAVVTGACCWLHRKGTLALAWRCPRLDLGGIRLLGRGAPWPLLDAAERVLEALARVGRYRTFFPGAKEAVLASVRRAIPLDAQLRAIQSGAPENTAGPRDRAVLPVGGDSGALSASSRATAAHDAAAALRDQLARLEATLQGIRGHLLRTSGAIAPVPDFDALLDGFEQRSSALAEAVAHVSAGPSPMLARRSGGEP